MFWIPLLMQFAEQIFLLVNQVAFAVLVTSGQYVLGDPIHCWVPAHFHGSWTKYTQSLCWVNDSYFVPLSDESHIPKAHEIKPEARIEYYQWIPFILLAQVGRAGFLPIHLLQVLCQESSKVRKIIWRNSMWFFHESAMLTVELIYIFTYTVCIRLIWVIYGCVYKFICLLCKRLVTCCS